MNSLCMVIYEDELLRVSEEADLLRSAMESHQFKLLGNTYVVTDITVEIVKRYPSHWFSEDRTRTTIRAVKRVELIETNERLHK